MPRAALDQGPQAELDDRCLGGSAGGSQGIREQYLIDVERRSHAYDVGAIVCIRQGTTGWLPAPRSLQPLLSARGLYQLADAEPSEHYTLAAVCARVPRGILCLLTALQVHRIGTRLSPEVWIAIPHGTRTPTAEVARLRVVRFSGALLTIGVEATRIDGVPTHITNPARTVLDCFRLSRLIDHETALEALRELLRRRRTAPSQLLQMATACGVDRSIRVALEVLGA